MRVFTVYVKDADAKNLVVVSDGVSKWGLLFGPLWALYNRMWLISAVSFAILFVAQNFTQLFSGYLSQFISNLLMISYWLFANDLIAYKLVKNNYHLQDIVIANNEEEAELSYLRNNLR